MASGRDNRITVVDLALAKTIDTHGAPALGPDQAPVTLVVFSDFECPWCTKEAPILQKLLAQNQDRLRIVFKHAPLPSHSRAEGAALAAIAAQLQGKFWPMHDALFAGAPWTAETIQSAALKAGLNMELFRLDQAGTEAAARLAKDRKDAPPGRCGLRACPVRQWLSGEEPFTRLAAIDGGRDPGRGRAQALKFTP